MFSLMQQSNQLKRTHVVKLLLLLRAHRKCVNQWCLYVRHVIRDIQFRTVKYLLELQGFDFWPILSAK